MIKRLIILLFAWALVVLLLSYTIELILIPFGVDFTHPDYESYLFGLRALCIITMAVVTIDVWRSLGD